MYMHTVNHKKYDGLRTDIRPAAGQKCHFIQEGAGSLLALVAEGRDDNLNPRGSLGACLVEEREHPQFHIQVAVELNSPLPDDLVISKY